MLGTPALIGLLFTVSLIIALITSLLLLIFGIEDANGKEMNIFEAYWTSLMHVIDQGTLSGDEDWQLRLIMLATTFIGIFLVSSLVSILNTGFSTKIEELKKGRSLVLEEGHTVILGWSSKVFSIISELVLANENQDYSCITILADINIDAMKDEIASKVGKTGKTKIILRHGNPRDPYDIQIANLNTAKSIIILSPEEEKSDAYVIKTIMAIVNNPNRKDGAYNIIAEIKDINNKEITEIIGKDEVTVVVSNDIISKITVQTSRQSGLSLIYNDLIDFANVEIYILPIKDTKGLTFREVVFAFDNTTIIGIKKEKGQFILNPDPDEIIGARDKLILIAEDDYELAYKPNPLYKPKDVNLALYDKETSSKTVQKTLILGWNRNAKIIIQELDHYVLSGSEICVIAENKDLEEQISDLKTKVRNQTITFKKGDINDRNLLNEIKLEYYDYIIILSYSDTNGIQEADAITLITLMHIRDIAAKTNKKFNIVSEILDTKNRALANLSRADDFIISVQIISNVLAQLSENKDLAVIFNELFDADGYEIYLKPASNFTILGQATDFYQITEVGMARRQMPIGYRIQKYADNPERNYGITLNPDKSEVIFLGPEDKVIVIAEE
jgi:K+/H+ antiporter YhaU regulatory subunit KhtT